MAASTAPPVVIVGAGTAGLVAAACLVDAGRHVTILEARERVGGRVYTEATQDGYLFDLGGQWVGATQHRVRHWLGRFGIGLYPQFDDGKHLFCLDGQTVQTYSGNISNLSLSGLGELARIVASVDDMCMKVPLDSPHMAERAKEWDEITVKEWQERHITNPHTKVLMNFIVCTVFAADPSQVSFLYFLFYMRGGDGYNNLANVHGGAQQDKIKGGAPALCQAMLNHVLADGRSRIHFDCQTYRITQQSDHAIVHTSKGAFIASRVVVAVPPVFASAIHFSPPLSGVRMQKLQRAPCGSVIKMIWVFERAWWRAHGFSGEVLTVTSPCMLYYDATSPDGAHPALVCFIAGATAGMWSERGPEKIKEAVIAQLHELFGDIVERPKEVLMKDWLADPWSAGCYVGVMGPGTLSYYAEDLQKPHGRVHFAGTDISKKWCGYIEGAVVTGEQAAEQVLKATDLLSKY
mmetsp:Transcript_9446/g.23608  ORF Transcript_9446/g.23608 Transcript_9446/m.23608 type:complete len:463 (-) Transcript_9446:62-1450(-)|eukprot:CAMPEP_0177671712 /NCGR_PEP_ID=MMETSP0447-20121125/24886_1 /TAXON_ID=0 /ORGANISM="Stygamoeba regulata, Strain BSH-02190019" /LENGTH=462 /DNA_ID=CAMNT_0019179195 /DNA_START=100 /DNA_END=1488 /DNA_ORIENTATION=-